MLGAIDKRNVYGFKVFARRVGNDRRGIGPARLRERGEEKAARDTRACATLHISCNRDIAPHEENSG